MKFDPQIVSSRLKQLENRMEMGRAMMELDKRHSPRKARSLKKAKVEKTVGYKEMYETEVHKQPVFEEMPQNMEESNDESEEMTKPEMSKDILHLH